MVLEASQREPAVAVDTVEPERSRLQPLATHRLDWITEDRLDPADRQRLAVSVSAHAGRTRYFSTSITGSMVIGKVTELAM